MNCAENAIDVKHERGCKFCRKIFATFAEVKESLNPDSLVADKYELIKDSNENNNNEVADHTSLCLATTCPKIEDVTSPQESGTNKLGTDNKTISEEQLRAKVCEDNRLSTEQQEDLYKVTAKYRQHLTKRSGEWTYKECEKDCNIYEILIYVRYGNLHQYGVTVTSLCTISKYLTD